MSDIDELTPVDGLQLPTEEQIPLEVAMLKRSVATVWAKQRHADKRARERAEAQAKAMRHLQYTAIGLIVTIAITAATALLQMGAYMERVDNLVKSTAEIERRLGSPSSRH